MSIQRYAAGQRFRPNAKQVNSWIDAAAAIQRGDHQATSRGVSNRQPILAKNNSGEAVSAYSLFYIDGPVFDADSQAEEYQSQIAVNGVQPNADDGNRLFVSQKYLADGEFDRNAVFQGMTFVRLDGPIDQVRAKGRSSQWTMVADSVGEALIIHDPGPADEERIALVRIDGGLGGGDCECDEVHEFSTNDVTTAGTFTATYSIDGTSEAVTWDWDATAAEVQTQFEGHSEIAVGEVTVEGGPWPDVALYVTFTIAGRTNVPFPTVDNTSLTGNAIMRRFSKGT